MHRISNAVRLLLLMIALGAFPAGAAPLQAQWEFRLLPGDAQGAAHPGLQQWRAATVPGSVHTDLLAHELIRDPYVGAPEAELQWIGLADWEYRARFDVDAASLAKAHAELRFDGLDTYAEVTLNGKPLLRADNAHRTWHARVEGRLRAKGNELQIVFRSPIRTLLPGVQAMPHRIAGNYPSPYGDEPKDAMVGNFARKPAYHFGWDWGPRYVTAGVWRRVDLQAWDAHRLTDVAVRTEMMRSSTSPTNWACWSGRTSCSAVACSRVTTRHSAPAWSPRRATTCAGCDTIPASCCGVATTKKKRRGRIGATAVT